MSARLPQARKVDFDSIAWEHPLPGERCKVHREHGRQLRLLELTREVVEPHWCEKAHTGMVLEGELEIDFRGERIVYRAGDGILIAAGESSGHKARALTPVVRLTLFEDA